MTIENVLNRALFSGYSSAQIGVKEILLCSLCTMLISIYVFCVYKRIHKESFYNVNFNISLIAMAVITSGIILTIQSSIVVSLGMVGALSIVRFRSAIKDPLDLVFIFWSISVGIICGAGFAFISAITSIVLTIVVLMISDKKKNDENMILVINADSYNAEKEVLDIVEKECEHFHVRARNITKNSLNLAIEICVIKKEDLINEIMKKESVINVSLVDYEGDSSI